MVFETSYCLDEYGITKFRDMWQEWQTANTACIPNDMFRIATGFCFFCPTSWDNKYAGDVCDMIIKEFRNE